MLLIIPITLVLVLALIPYIYTQYTCTMSIQPHSPLDFAVVGLQSRCLNVHIGDEGYLRVVFDTSNVVLEIMFGLINKDTGLCDYGMIVYQDFNKLIPVAKNTNYELRIIEGMIEYPYDYTLTVYGEDMITDDEISIAVLSSAVTIMEIIIDVLCAIIVIYSCVHCCRKRIIKKNSTNKLADEDIDTVLVSEGESEV